MTKDKKWIVKLSKRQKKQKQKEHAYTFIFEPSRSMMPIQSLLASTHMICCVSRLIERELGQARPRCASTFRSERRIRLWVFVKFRALGWSWGFVSRFIETVRVDPDTCQYFQIWCRKMRSYAFRNFKLWQWELKHFFSGVILTSAVAVHPGNKRSSAPISPEHLTVYGVYTDTPRLAQSLHIQGPSKTAI